MEAQDLVLNIAVNLDRISRFAVEGRENRVKLFMQENDHYIDEVDNHKISIRFRKTFNIFKEQLSDLKKNNKFGEDAEVFLTWANILQHRAKLA